MDCCYFFITVIGCFLIVFLCIALIDASDTKQQKFAAAEEEKRRAEEANRRAEEARRAANAAEVTRLMDTFSNTEQLVLTKEKELIKQISSFFRESRGSYTLGNDRIRQFCCEISEHLEEMSKINNQLIRKSSGINFSDKLNRLKSTVLPKSERMASQFSVFGQRIKEFPDCVIMSDDYGKIRKDFWDEVTAMDRKDVRDYIQHCYSLLQETDIDRIYTIDLDRVLRCMWFFASEKIVSASDVQRAQYVFEHVYRGRHADIVIADLYIKKKLGSEDALRDTIRDVLKPIIYSNQALLLASALMWMGAHQSEYTVLQYMLSNGMQMTAKAQERLHALSSNGGKAPAGFDVVTTEDMLYFDVSSLAWKDEDYTGFFEGLAFRDKALTYSLAVRDEVKELLLAQNVRFHNGSALLDKLKSEFEAEYGPDVTVKEVNAAAVAGNGEERSAGILAVPGEQPQLGVLMLTAKIGKKLVIKFYTLYIPQGTDPAAQKQHTMTLLKKLSLSVSMWESSLRDTMLMATERLLNASVHTAPYGTTQATVPTSDEPVF